MRTIITLAALVTLLPAAQGRATAPALALDPVSSIAQFTVTKVGFADVTGRFTKMEGDMRWDPAAPETGFVRWRVAVASVVTEPGATNRDRALQAPEYFDAARHPWLAFESTGVQPLAPGRLEVAGNLTIRGTTRPITITVRHAGPPSAPIFETAFEVDRYDYGIVGGRVMSRLIGRTAYIYLKAVTKEPTS